MTNATQKQNEATKRMIGLETSKMFQTLETIFKKQLKLDELFAETGALFAANGITRQVIEAKGDEAKVDRILSDDTVVTSKELKQMMTDVIVVAKGGQPYLKARRTPKKERSQNQQDLCDKYDTQLSNYRTRALNAMFGKGENGGSTKTDDEKLAQYLNSALALCVKEDVELTGDTANVINLIREAAKSGKVKLAIDS